MKAILAVLMLAAVVVAAGPAPAARYAAVVIDADTGAVLHGNRSTARRYPASLTKMMTLYLVFERLQSGKFKLSTRMKIPHRATLQPPSRLGLKRGSTIAIRDVIRALAVKSANDVATAVAYFIAGNERKFARVMNRKARELGMHRTSFRNASGLWHSQQWTTARDMARLARALMTDFPQYYHYFSLRSFKLRGRTYRSHNRLLRRYSGADGLKTGYISKSGFNLAFSAKRNGRRLITVVMGGPHGPLARPPCGAVDGPRFRHIEAAPRRERRRPCLGGASGRGARQGGCPETRAGGGKEGRDPARRRMGRLAQGAA